MPCWTRKDLPPYTAHPALETSGIEVVLGPIEFSNDCRTPTDAKGSITIHLSLVETTDPVALKQLTIRRCNITRNAYVRIIGHHTETRRTLG